MTRYTTTSSRPCSSVSPRPQSGLSREWVNGSLQPMDYGDEPFLSMVRRYALCWGIGFGLAIGAYELIDWLEIKRLWWLL